MICPRSILFVPGDSEKKIAKSRYSDAEAIVFDLEDSVEESRKAMARDMVRLALAERVPERAMWVRINPLGTEQSLLDITAIVAAAPDVILLPKANGAADVALLSSYLDIMEVAEDVPHGSIGIVPVATETARAILNISSYDRMTPRLRGITWGAEDLATDIGAASNSDAQGRLNPLYIHARNMALAAATAAGVPAIDTAAMALDSDDLPDQCRQSYRDGFVAKLAIHPAQVPVINTAFRATDDELRTARAILAKAAEQPDAGVFQLDGQMIDRPHIEQARRLLTRNEQGEIA